MAGTWDILVGLWATNNLHIVLPTATLCCHVQTPQAPNDHVAYIYCCSSRLQRWMKSCQSSPL